MPTPPPPQKEADLFSDWWILWCWNYPVTDILVSYILSRHWKENLEYLKLGFGRLVFCSFIVKVFQKWTGPKITKHFEKGPRCPPSLRPAANTYFPVSSIDFCFLKSGASGSLSWAIIKTGTVGSKSHPSKWVSVPVAGNWEMLDTRNNMPWNKWGVQQVVQGPCQHLGKILFSSGSGQKGKAKTTVIPNSTEWGQAPTFPIHSHHQHEEPITSFLCWPCKSLGHGHIILEKLNEERKKDAWGTAPPWLQPRQQRRMSLGDPSCQLGRNGWQWPTAPQTVGLNAPPSTPEPCSFKGNCAQ